MKISKKEQEKHLERLVKVMELVAERLEDAVNKKQTDVLLKRRLLNYQYATRALRETIQIFKEVFGDEDSS